MGSTLLLDDGGDHLHGQFPYYILLRNTLNQGTLYIFFYKGERRFCISSNEISKIVYFGDIEKNEGYTGRYCSDCSVLQKG